MHSTSTSPECQHQAPKNDGPMVQLPYPQAYHHLFMVLFLVWVPKISLVEQYGRKVLGLMESDGRSHTTKSTWAHDHCMPQPYHNLVSLQTGVCRHVPWALPHLPKMPTVYLLHFDQY